MIHHQQQNPPSPNSAASPAPLNLAPSRARNKFAERLAARAKQEAEESSALQGTDPDTADSAAVAQAFEMPAQPRSDLPDLDLSAVTERQINELIGVSAGGEQTRVVSAYSSSSSSSSSDLDSGDDEDAAHPTTVTQGLEEEVVVGVKRRPSTTEAKKRVPLDDGEDEEQQQQRPQVKRMVSDPFESPVESSGEESSDDSVSSGEELSFGRQG
jgi:SIT4-associating protein SAP185/190